MIISINYNGTMWNQTGSSVEKISTERIDFLDRYYSISPFPFNEERLFTSIKAAGVTTPVRLEGSPGNFFRIVSGFKRVAVSLRLGIEWVPAIIQQKGDPLHTFRQAALENFGTRDLHDLEKAEIIRKLVEIHLVAEAELLSLYLPSIGVKGTRYELERMLSLAALGESLKRACITEGLLCSSALEIRAWPETEQQLFVEQVARLRLGTNKQKQLLRLLEDLKKREKTSLASLWCACGLDGDGTAELGFEEIHARLSRRRYPVLAGHEARWESLKERLRLRGDIKLQVPRHFDGDRITITLSAADPAELREKAEELLAAADKKEMKEIFSLL